MHSNGVKAILFDLDNTLIDTRGAGEIAFEKVAELLRTRLHHGDIETICKKFKQKLLEESYQPFADLTIDQVRINHWDKAIEESGGLDHDPSLAAQCYWLWKNTRLDHLCIPGPVQRLLQELKTTHKLLLLTNGEAQTQREKIQAVCCRGLFDAVVVGGEHAEEKPAPSIFQHCFHQLGVGPQDCIMVGDSLDTDILGGINVGIRATVWITDKGTIQPEASIKPDYVLATVLELPSVLSTL
ncbi:N-acylneuraminate-9-phosphatase [Paramormyrops kingsleyae]|uniref:N-acetylneuraminic acid phosphatase n=1 Tax=Paramormyrops kingsleyae TaxID=1676925 RepID=A0A3B3S0J8_9TELE|nr:N-acylneuraminate-9-phosphatase [Paramormyrops kingsleyae]